MGIGLGSGVVAVNGRILIGSWGVRNEGVGVYIGIGRVRRVAFAAISGHGQY